MVRRIDQEKWYNKLLNYENQESKWSMGGAIKSLATNSIFAQE